MDSGSYIISQIVYILLIPPSFCNLSTRLCVKALGLAEGEVLSSGWLTVYYYVQILRLTGRLCDEDVARRATNRIRVAS